MCIVTCSCVLQNQQPGPHQLHPQGSLADVHMDVPAEIPPQPPIQEEPDAEAMQQQEEAAAAAHMQLDKQVYEEDQVAAVGVGAAGVAGVVRTSGDVSFCVVILCPLHVMWRSVARSTPCVARMSVCAPKANNRSAKVKQTNFLGKLPLKWRSVHTVWCNPPLQANLACRYVMFLVACSRCQCPAQCSMPLQMMQDESNFKNVLLS